MQLEKSSTLQSISIKFSQQPSYLSFAISSIVIKVIPLNFGNVQAVSNGIFITRSIRKPRPSI